MFPGWGWDFGWGWAAVIGSLILLALLVLPWFFFLLNLQTLLSRVSPQNRSMSPGQVWLNFIPIFNLGWFIYTVAKVRDSVRAEYQSRRWPIEGDQGYNVGLVAGILAIAAFVIGWIPVLGWAIGIAELVCWILYWLKTHEIKNRLGEGPLPWRGQTTPPYGQYPPNYPPGPTSSTSQYAAGQQYPGGPAPYSAPRPPASSPQAAPGGPPPFVVPVPGPPAGQPPAAQQPTGQPPTPQQPAGVQTGSAPAGPAATGGAADIRLSELPIEPLGATEMPDEAILETETWQEAPGEEEIFSGGETEVRADAGQAEGAASAEGAAGERRSCSACGTSIDPSDRFCRTCGLPLY